MAGGLFSIHVDYFQHIGTYDNVCSDSCRALNSTSCHIYASGPSPPSKCPAGVERTLRFPSVSGCAVRGPPTPPPISSPPGLQSYPPPIHPAPARGPTGFRTLLARRAHFPAQPSVHHPGQLDPHHLSHQLCAPRRGLDGRLQGNLLQSAARRFVAG